MDFNFNRLNAYLIVLLVWAGVYLPGLGVLDIDFNEGRRIMPAVGMLESGNWRVPTLAGEEYFKKPPMINWLIAGSFIAFGERSEFAARFPSAIAMLAFVTLLMLMPSPFLDMKARMASSILFLTCIGCLDSGRQAEIDSVYSCVSGMSMIAWLNLWAGKKTGSFLLWFIPSLIVGFGLLLKGPIILFFFYLLVLSVLAYERKLKVLLSAYHLIGIAVMLGIFLSWAMTIPSSASSNSAGAKMTGTWISEIAMRFKGEELNFAKWPVRALGAFLNLLPWLLFAPLLFSRNIIAGIPDDRRQMFKGCRFAIIAALVAVNLMPGVKARYSMPIYGLALVMIGWTLMYASFPRIEKFWRNLILAISGILAVACVVSFIAVISGFAGKISFIPADSLVKLNAAVDGIRTSRDMLFSCGLVMAASVALFVWLLRRRELMEGSFKLVLASGTLAVALSLSAANFAVPVMAQFQKGHEELAGRINAMTNGGTLYAYRTECEPFLFYIRPSVKFVRNNSRIDANVRYLLYRADLQAELDKSGVLSGRKSSELSRFGHRRTEYVLLAVDGG